ncbi:PREDICTED: pyridoxal phosphate phosphatase [Miniopterus natalensis]|uniref:pyridoxal phosphate phosphatase n=1 Tax=Miniopterus natalensis TaxID=291302 RepID=UPI0007A72BC7|nr:PREDICTED: pyridoxal phosphate phosphatase [Miniopterus natalensis]
MPPPQVSSTRSSPPAPPLPPGSGSPVTPRALPRRLVGSSLRAPTVPPPLPPIPPQPARRQSRRSPASPSQTSPGPASSSPVSLSMAAQVDLGAATEDGGTPEADTALTPPKGWGPTAFAYKCLDPGAAPRVRAVLVGYDEHFSFAKLSEACAHLRDPDCLLVATDRDPWHPLSDGSRTPGTGSLAAAVETASGRQALVVGKPSPYMFECIKEHFSVDPARMLMVGDRLETDILFGHRCGMTTVLTLTGVSRLEEAQAYLAASQQDLVPHYYVESIADLMGGLED